MIQEDKFEVYETCILCGQVPHEDVPRLMSENKKFFEWHSDRRSLSHFRFVIQETNGFID